MIRVRSILFIPCVFAPWRPILWESELKNAGNIGLGVEQSRKESAYQGP